MSILTSTPAPLTVATLAHGRRAAVINQITGLAQSLLMPAELVIIHMNEAPYTGLPETPFPVRAVQFDSRERLPLAKARNLARQQAAHERLIFLDADCVPHAGLTQAYAAAFDSRPEQLLVGPVRYLRERAAGQPQWLQQMDALSTPDPVRQLNENLSYEWFWSLNFGCTKMVFDRIGGFDERYEGYGAEDTDFGFSARQQQVPIATLEAMAYHQYHASYSPPLNHLADIVANASRFYQKWQVWPMQGWLRKFQGMGLVEWGPSALHIIRLPTTQEIAAQLKP